VHPGGLGKRIFGFEVELALASRNWYQVLARDVGPRVGNPNPIGGRDVSKHGL
jgi:hypothetical protein